MRRNEKVMYFSMKDERKKIKPEIQISQKVGTSKNFSRGDKANWNQKFSATTEDINVTAPSCRLLETPV